MDAILLPVNSSLIRLVLPGNARLELTLQPDGTYRNGTHPFLSGAVLSSLSGGDHQLRFKDGSAWRFRDLFLGLEFLIEQADRYGNRVTIQRDASGRLVSIQDPAGRALEVSYSGARLTQIRDPLGREVRYAYDGSGRLSTVTDPAGGVTRYTYDGAGRITTITGPRDIVFLTNTYSLGRGRVLTQTQELLRDPVLLIIGGGGSAILCRWLDRPTLDLDVLASEPALGEPFRAAVAQVADEQGLPAAWINDGAKAYVEVLPPDFRSRLIEVGVYGRLTLRAIGRPDWILLKLFALRAEDVADLRALAPTPTELAFVRQQLPRRARFHAARAHVMELYLEQGERP